jgi:TonB family protein
VAISETFDTLDIVFRDMGFGDSAAIHDERSEPILAAAAAPVFVEFDEPTRLDPERIGLIWEIQPAAGRPIRLRSPLVSLALHFLPLLAIIGWPTPVVDVAPPIAVALVFEEPPPPPQPKMAEPPPPAQPQAGRLSSVDMGDVKPKQLGPTTSDAPPAAGDPQPDQTQTATAAPVPPAQPMPKPSPPKEKSVFQLPKPAGAPVPHHEPAPHEAPRAAQFAGPSATRDEYLAYLVKLTRQHMDLLPMSTIGDRRGETVVSVVVYDNGVIGPLGVVRSSGYSDIDQRIEEMVAAVRRFPPLPQWYQGHAVQLELTLRFPEALER